MPAKSKAQNRLMQAACRGKTKSKVPKKVACEYVAATQSVKNLPERKKKSAKK